MRTHFSLKTHAIAVSLLFNAYAHAGLGDVSVSSNLGDPFNARVSLSGVGDDNLQSLKIELNSASTPLRWAVRPTNAGVFLDITSNQPVTEPFVRFVIVAETTAYNEYSQFTEKVAKPIVALRPFVAFCGQHYLKNLKRLGFQTFGDVIDETYDAVADAGQRFNLAWNQVEHLCQEDPQQILEKLLPTLEYNKNHFLSTDWVKPAKDIGQQKSPPG